MPLFDFKLRPLEKIEPWGDDTPEGPNLHWFALTDGWYSMAVGSARLFQYSAEFLSSCGDRGSFAEEGNDWVDYQVIRLYEDVLELLPRSLDEVPDEVHALAVNLDRSRNWEDLIHWAFWDAADEEDEESQTQVRDLCAAASQLPSLGSLHLVQGPNISVWSHKKRVYISWDNADRVEDGIPRWTASFGVHSLPLEEWMTEVESFHYRLMAAMQERVDILHNKNPIPHVRIDLPALVLEHQQRQKMLGDALQRTSQTDWAAVIRATAELEELRKAWRSKDNFN